jgi:hypothetical protein
MNFSIAMTRFSVLFSCLTITFLGIPVARAQDPEQIKGTPAEPVGADDSRVQIAAMEKLKDTLVDRGAVLYSLATERERLHETREALAELKECIGLQEGFNPESDAAFRAMATDKEFKDLVERARRDFPAVTQAHVAFETDEKDLVPEGLAYDTKNDVYYLSSLNRHKIVKISHEGRVSDFVPSDRYKLLPVLGIRMDPTDGSVWANSSEDERGRSELLHFDGEGKLLGRYAVKDQVRHEFNDLVLRKNGEVILTDSLSNHVYRFDRGAQKFSVLPTYRELAYPNGIALADDDNQIFIADNYGIVHVNLQSGASAEVNPGPRNTVSGADGLYWHKGSLIAVQNGIGAPRIAAFRLSKDGLQVTQTSVLENRSAFTVLPTTGALHGNDFYFIVNSQLDNLNNGHVMDITKLERVRIGVLRLP